jgi:hypothetical protein
MATSTKGKQTEQDDVNAMFEDGPAGVEDDFDDLLDNVEEDDSEGWVPKEKGEGISGIVVKVSETRSDFAKDGEDPMVPTITLECNDPENPGQKIKWRVIGFGAVLKREIEDANPKVGDRMAVKYFGERTLKTGKFQGKKYKHFGVALRRAAQNA